MQIEFQNCSLEIGYIGTPDEIMMAVLVDAFLRVSDAIMDFARRFAGSLADAFEEAAENLRAWSMKGARR